MNKKRMAIISTWNEICGIAHYAAYLKTTMEKEYTVDVFPLPRKIFMIQNPTQKEKRIADNRIKEICKNLQEYDVINLQFEPGIFGTNIIDIARRVKWIVNSSNNFVFTFHSIAADTKIKAKYIVINLLKFKITHVINDIRCNFLNKKWDKLMKYLDKSAETKKISAIIHSQKDQFYLQMSFDNIHVYDVPLIYMTKDERENIHKKAMASNLKNILPLKKKDTRYIGIFGFISSYKGYITAFKSLEYLPSNYELLVFGSVHEGSLTDGMAISPVVKDLVDFIEKTDKKSESKDNTNSKDQDLNEEIFKKEKKIKFHNRIHFMGSVSDDDLLYGMMLCDCILFPYLNINQTASGPISLAIELNRQIIASRNTTFTELSKYYPHKFEFCDLGNYIEIAQKVEIFHNQIEEEKKVNGMRWVFYPEKEGSLYPDYTFSVYQRAIMQLD